MNSVSTFRPKHRHMERRYTCPACGCCDLIIHRDSLHITMEYVCPSCKHTLRTEPPTTKEAA